MEKAQGERKEEFDASEIEYVSYGGEHHLPLIMNLVDQELSEPYSIFTYRYFVYLWPQLSFLAFHKGKCVGTVVCKMGDHRNSTFRGYIAMLVVIKPYRGRGIGNGFGFLYVLGFCAQFEVVLDRILNWFFLYYRFIRNAEGKVATELVTRSIQVMMESGCEEVTLEAEVTNKGALALYGRLGFIRAKRLFRYYLNGVDAFRLKLLFPQPELHPFLPMMVDRDPTQKHDDHSPPSEEFSEIHRNL
ncbi:hypothetical protein POTOM_041279 [Populus tomentosa]|uniref:N-acetyltransferase domain-containing protein n=1 Tax=Populus tomentosa TaxID=118781 RepID=A0A8X7YLJ7_POPTO|nr:hypothetical protein POTOM_041279 [Populus tomentosa]